MHLYSSKGYSPYTSPENTLNKIDVISNIQHQNGETKNTDLFEYLSKETIIWINNVKFLFDDEHLSSEDFKKKILNHQCLYTGPINNNNYSKTILFNSSAQPTFNKNFEILINHLDEYKNKGYQNIITVSSDSQMMRLQNIFKNYLHLVNDKLFSYIV